MKKKIKRHHALPSPSALSPPFSSPAVAIPLARRRRPALPRVPRRSRTERRRWRWCLGHRLHGVQATVRAPLSSSSPPSIMDSPCSPSPYARGPTGSAAVVPPEAKLYTRLNLRRPAADAEDSIGWTWGVHPAEANEPTGRSWFGQPLLEEFTGRIWNIHRAMVPIHVICYIYGFAESFLLTLTTHAQFCLTPCLTLLVCNYSVRQWWLIDDNSYLQSI